MSEPAPFLMMALHVGATTPADRVMQSLAMYVECYPDSKVHGADMGPI